MSWLVWGCCAPLRADRLLCRVLSYVKLIAKSMNSWVALVSGPRECDQRGEVDAALDIQLQFFTVQQHRASRWMDDDGSSSRTFFRCRGWSLPDWMFGWEGCIPVGVIGFISLTIIIVMGRKQRRSSAVLSNFVQAAESVMQSQFPLSLLAATATIRYRACRCLITDWLTVHGQGRAGRGTFPSLNAFCSCPRTLLLLPVQPFSWGSRRKGRHVDDLSVSVSGNVGIPILCLCFFSLTTNTAIYPSDTAFRQRRYGVRRLHKMNHDLKGQANTLLNSMPFGLAKMVCKPYTVLAPTAK